MTDIKPVVRGKAAVNGAQLYYEYADDGEALVLLHAGLADSRMWDSQFLELARHHRVLRYDRRGFGKSDLPSGPFSHGHDLNGLLDFLGIPRAHLLGCSQGSALALDYTLDHSERVLDLILESPGLGGYTPTGPIPGTIVELGEKLQEGDLTHAAELAVQIWLLGPIRSASQVDEVLQDRVFEMCRTALPNYFVAEDVLRPPAAERLDQIKRPTMLVAGDQDDPAILDITNLLASGITPSQKIILPGVGHLLNMETPHEFNRLAELFLREHPSPAHPVH